jgi:A/G-specific adenine glycosylase
MGARQALLEWGRANRRHFSWRTASDPYHVLMAEILLHRTRADQVEPVFRELVRLYPQPAALVAADSDVLKRLLYPLGLHWRVPLLRAAVMAIIHDHGGEVPPDREKLERLPGVGPYIASAVRCFAFGEPDPLLDTNTVRIAARVYGVTATDASRRSPRFRELLRPMIESTYPRESNFALLDLGAQICRPSHPHCGACPLQLYCVYGRTKLRTQIDDA